MCLNIDGMADDRWHLGKIQGLTMLQARFQVHAHRSAPDTGLNTEDTNTTHVLLPGCSKLQQQQQLPLLVLSPLLQPKHISRSAQWLTPVCHQAALSIKKRATPVRLCRGSSCATASVSDAAASAAVAADDVDAPVLPGSGVWRCKCKDST
jgi:hypothetical protein